VKQRACLEALSTEKLQASKTPHCGEVLEVFEILLKAK